MVDLDRWFEAVRQLVFDRQAGTWVSFGMLVLAVGFLVGTWAAWLLETLENRRDARGPRTRTYGAAAADHATNLLAMMVAWLPRPRPPSRGLLAAAIVGWAVAFGSLLVDFRVAYPAAGVGTVLLCWWLWRGFRWTRMLELRQADALARRQADEAKRRQWAEEQARIRTAAPAARESAYPRRYPAPV
jgi:hypothetical protein